MKKAVHNSIHARVAADAIKAPSPWKRALGRAAFGELASPGAMLVVLAALSAPSGWAACTVAKGYTVRNLTLNLGQVTVKDDTPVGSVIASQDFPFGGAGQNVYFCLLGGSDIAELINGKPLFGDASKQYVESGVKGIGIRVAAVFGASNSFNYYPFQETWRPLTTVHFYPDQRTRVELIKTEATTGSGPLTNALIARQYADGDPGNPTITVSVAGNGTTIISPTCKVDTGSLGIPVNFGPVSVKKFAGPGSSAQPRTFNIQLNCSAGVGTNNNVYLSLDGTQDPSGAQGVLQVTQGTGVAKGVGIQLLDKNNLPVTFRQPALVGPSMSGTYSVTYTARYYQTGPSIAPGTANGTATFSVSYQ